MRQRCAACGGGGGANSEPRPAPGGKKSANGHVWPEEEEEQEGALQARPTKRPREDGERRPACRGGGSYRSTPQSGCPSHSRTDCM